MIYQLNIANTSKSIAYGLPQSCLASNTKFILFYYQSFLNMHLFLICFKNRLIARFFSGYRLNHLKKDDRENQAIYSYMLAF